LTSTPARALVTGAAGFVGSAVARRLLDQGFEVRVMTRASSDPGNLDGLDAEVVQGDLTDPASLRRAVQGCGALFHVAADYRLWVRDPKPLYAANVDGTREILRAAADAGVSRIVYTSSVATLGLPPGGGAGDEETPVSLEDMIGHYKRSKYMAEEIARELAQQGVPVVIVNPSTPVGPRDRKPTPTGRMVLDAAAGRMPAYVDTGLNVAHVDDIAEGHLQAYHRGSVGRRYVLGGEDLTLREILTEIAAICGRKPPRIRLTQGMVLPVAHIAEAWARLTGATPNVTVEGVKLSKKMMFFSSARAQRELGYAPRPAQQALRDAVEWFRGNGDLQ